MGEVSTIGHVGGIEGEIAVGSTLYLNPKSGLRFGWKTDAMVANERLRQICVEGPGSSVGKILTIAAAPHLSLRPISRPRRRPHSISPSR